jgi:DDE family transposase
MAHIKKHLGFAGLLSTMAGKIKQISDNRQKAKVDYSIHDCVMSAFAMMYLQDPSLLAFQRRIQDRIQRNNLNTIFGVHSIPKDNQLRNVLDTLPIDTLSPIFADFLRDLQRGKHLAKYQMLDGKYLIPIDGSEYFSSEKIHCPHCLYKKPKKGNIRYYHQILQAVIVHPDQRHVLPMAPEPIQNTDGSNKQDCEINAAKRLIAKIRATHPKLPIIIGGDGLYSKQPFIDELKTANMSFVLVAKPSDHKILFEWVQDMFDLKAGEQMVFTDKKGRKHKYRWVNDVPLNGSKDADQVNFFDYRIITNKKTTYRNSWVTDIPVNEKNIVTLVKAGRARWKIENETFNTLKNQGYHLEHNFGHGRQNLSMIFFMINLLAFYVHQILDLTDPLYQKVRYSKFTSRKEFWNQLRCTIRILIFPHWQSLLQFIWDPEKGIPP